VLDQIFIAFGQGAGVMRVADQAIIYATQTYWHVIQTDLQVWHDNPFRVREYARTLGHLSAHVALRNNRTIITQDDVTEAIGDAQIRAMLRKLSQPDEAHDKPDDEGDCPFCTA
jgi:orotate phosphoribosyltransferase-like protein